MSLKQRILTYIEKRNEFVNGAEIEELALSIGFKGSTASRILRQLHVDGLLDRQQRGRARSVYYRIPTISYQETLI